MKKLLTLALALAALAVFAGLSVGQDKQKVLTGKVTQVNKENKTFTVEATFSAKEMKTLPGVGDVLDITYTQTPCGPMAATTVNGTRSNGSERKKVLDGQTQITGKVTKVNAKINTFAVEVTFSAKEMKDPLLEVGKIYDITFTQTTPGVPQKSVTIDPNLGKCGK